MASRDDLNIGSQSLAHGQLASHNDTVQSSREHQAHARPLFCGAALLEALLKFTGREFLEVQPQVDEIKALRLCSRSLKHLVDLMAPLTGIRVEDGLKISQMLQDCGKLLLPRAETLELPEPFAESVDQVFSLISYDFKYLKSFSFYDDYSWGPMLATGLFPRLTALTSLEIQYELASGPQALLCCLSHTNLKSLRRLRCTYAAEESVAEYPSPYLLSLGAKAFINLSNLEELYLDGPHFSIMDAPHLFPEKDMLSCLTDLTLRAEKYPKRQGKFSTPRWPNLEHLSLFEVGDQGVIDLLTRTHWFKTLKMLLLHVAKKEKLDFKDVSNAVNLEELSVRWDYIPPDMGEVRLPKLQKLSLIPFDDYDTGDEVESLDISKFPMLAEFHCHRPGNKLAAYINLDKPPAKLRSFGARYGELEDEDAQKLSLKWISKCEEFTHWDVSDYMLLQLFNPDEGDISAGPRWPNLRMLKISINRQFRTNPILFLKLMYSCIHGQPADFPNLTRFIFCFQDEFSEDLKYYLKTDFPMTTLWPTLEEFSVKSWTESLCFKRHFDGTWREVQE